MVPLLPLRDGVRALPISSFRQSMPSFYMNAPDCICSPGRLPLGAFCAGRDDLEREAMHDDRISIRAPRAGCDSAFAHWIVPKYRISIHAPRAGCDVITKSLPLVPSNISIHAPRAGCDHAAHYDPNVHIANFNPRTPCGVRPTVAVKACPSDTFQSTHPVRGATPHRACQFLAVVQFQSTHPVRGATETPSAGRRGPRHFNPRTPCGVRPSSMM